MTNILKDVHYLQADEAEAKLSVKKPEIVEEKTLKRPSAKGKEAKVWLLNILEKRF